MSGGALSQDEINSLLAGTAPEESAPESPESNTEEQVPEVEGSSSEKLLTDKQIEVLNEIIKDFSESGVSVLGTIIQQDVKTVDVSGSIINVSDLKEKLSGKQVMLDTKFSDGMEGDFSVAVNTEFGSILADLMMGQDGSNPPEELTELHESAINEAVNQLIGSSLTSISKRAGLSSLATDVPAVSIKDINSDISDGIFTNENIFLGTIQFELLDNNNDYIYFLFPMDTAINITKHFIEEDKVESSPEPLESSPIDSGKNAAPSAEPNKISELQQKNLNLLLDTPLVMSVSLGECKILMKDILAIGNGTIIELNKNLGDPVDVLVGDKPVARGEVVVVEENFGVKVLELVTPNDRIELKKHIGQ